MELTATAGVILGMVHQGHRTGYEIKSAVDRSIRFFWAASYGQIYPELKRLEQAGLLESAADPAGGRQRTVYELTPAGEQALEEWLARKEHLAFELRSDGLLKLFFADFMPPATLVEHLRSMRAQHEAVLARLRAVEPAARARAEADELEWPLQVLEGGLTLHSLFADWCRMLEERLLERDSAGTATS